MTVEADIRYKMDLEFQKVINGYNKINAAHEREIVLLKKKVDLSKKAERSGKKATRATSNIMGGSLPQFLSAAIALRTIVSLFREIEGMTLRPFENVKELLESSKKLVQLSVGTGEPGLTKRLQKLGDDQAVRQGIPRAQGRLLAFGLKSRELTEKQIANFPRVDFLPNLLETVNFAADAVKQFDEFSLKDRGIQKFLGGGAAGARGSKVETGVIISLLGRPSQFVEGFQGIGISAAELIALVSVGVAGTTDPREAATQTRAFFSQILTKPGLRGVKRQFEQGGLLGGLDFIAGLSPRRQDALFGSEVRSGAASRFFQKESSAQAIREAIPRVQQGIAFAGLGGNKDVLQEMARAMDANTEIQQSMIPMRAKLKADIEASSLAAGLAGRGSFKETRAEILLEATIAARGGGTSTMK